MRIVLSLALLIVLQSTITLSFTASGNDIDADFERIRSSYTTFTYLSASTVNTVEVSGEWDDWKRHNMSLDKGVFSISIEINQGYYCYKFIIDGNEWILDPKNNYKKYCDGILNSGIIVENITNPYIKFSSVSDSFLNFTAEYYAGVTGAEALEFEIYLMNNFNRYDTNYSWNQGDWTVNVNLNFNEESFEFGKYTLYMHAIDLDGRKSNVITYPFWFEKEEFHWDGALIYMIMTDRFVNGNISNDPSKLPDVSYGADWEGGDFAGIISKLESGYFQDLGVSALWLTPFNTGANGTYLASDNIHRVSSYHGYWPTKARQIDPRLGTAEELKELITLAHSQGIRVINDFVINHVHSNHEYYSSNPEWFRIGCILGTTGCDWTEHALDGVFSSYMPDVNWQNAEVSERFIADALWWQKEFDLDGSRIDAVKHVEPLAITNLVSRFNSELENKFTDYYLLGETAMGWNGDDLVDNLGEYEAINRYLGEKGLDGQGDFVLYHAVVDNVFRYGSKDYQHLDYWTQQSQLNYVEGAIMTPYLGSHDTPRLVSRLDSTSINPNNKWHEQSLPQQPTTYLPYTNSKLAFSWLLTIPGAPVLYMGDEYGEYGGSDPDNRHSFRSNENLNLNEEKLLSFVERLGTIRKNSLDLQVGTYKSIFSDTDLLVFSRETLNSETLVFINSGSASRELVFTKNSEVFYNTYHNLIINETVTADLNEIKFTVGSQNISIFASNSSENHEHTINQTIDNNITIVDEPITNSDNEENIDKPLNEGNQNLGEDTSPEVNKTSIDNNDALSSASNDNESGLLLLRSILFITFLSLIITFFYTRGS